MERAQSGGMKVSLRRDSFLAVLRPALPRRAELGVWVWNMAVDEQTLAELEGTLSDDEWQRVRRFRSHRHARRFVVRRGMMRGILGNCLNVSPHELQFEYGAHGKPALAPSLSKALEFNLSDSGGVAVLAVGTGHPVGVDIERLRPIPEAEALAARAFAAEEVEALKRAGASRQAYVFLRMWTHREAIAKAQGCGLQCPPDLFAEAEAAAKCRLRRPALLRAPSAAWRIYPLPAPAGLIGALATSQEVEEISCYSSSPGLAPDLEWLCETEDSPLLPRLDEV